MEISNNNLEIDYLETTENHCLFNFSFGEFKFRGKIFLHPDRKAFVTPRKKFGVYGYFYPLNNIKGYIKCLKNLRKLTYLIAFNVGNDLYQENRSNY